MCLRHHALNQKLASSFWRESLEQTRGLELARPDPGLTPKHALSHLCTQFSGLLPGNADPGGGWGGDNPLESRILADYEE
jgi:hypothetical protein